jgi:diguanylate cyclase (GGDEF)-like protein
MVVFHFAAFLFLNFSGIVGILATVAGLSALIWAGLLFMWASVPYRREISSRAMFIALGATNTLYIIVLTVTPETAWAMNIAASLLGVLPLLVALWVVRNFNRPLRWIVVSLYCALSIFILSIQHRPSNGDDLALNAVLFTVYFGCCLHFWFGYRRATAGAFITIAGFLAWSAVFVVAPIMAAFFPAIHVESEVWNLPKYVVAVGMILLLLEDQIERTRHLAQHDHLTGLANRRLFQFRLESALERARRTGSQTALLVVDLDQFKQVNDTLGHHVGDLVLQRVAAMFLARVRRSDTVARTGGDEFSIILEEPTSRESALTVVRSLLQLLDEPLQLGDGHMARIGASVGLAIFPEDANDAQSLCIAADLRMYDSKHESGGVASGTQITTPSPLSPPAARLRRATDLLD